VQEYNAKNLYSNWFKSSFAIIIFLIIYFIKSKIKVQPILLMVFHYEETRDFPAVDSTSYPSSFRVSKL
jgi:hypothetical protein